MSATMSIIILCLGSALFGALIVVAAIWAERLSKSAGDRWWAQRNSEWPHPISPPASARGLSDSSNHSRKSPTADSIESGHPHGSQSQQR